MSGIYIPGMEMPKSCNECRFFVDAWCYAFEADDWRNAYYKPPEGERRNICPLVPVPEHGRLIDASALLQSIKEARKAQPEIADVYDDDYFLVAEWVCSSPTIIPADKEGEG